MSSFYVECIGAEKFQNAEQMLADVPGGMERALKSATKRAVSFLRTQSTKEIRQRYDISRKNIRAEQNIRVNYRYFNGVEARVSFRGNKIPLWRYGGSSPKTPTVNPDKTIMAIVNGNLRPVHPGIAAAGHQLVSTSPTTFSRAFVAQMKSGHIGIFERTGGKTATGDAEIKEKRDAIASYLAEGRTQFVVTRYADPGEAYELIAEADGVFDLNDMRHYKLYKRKEP